jgi:hypothetical protein
MSQLHRENAHVSAEQLHHEARKKYWISKAESQPNRCIIRASYAGERTLPDVRQRWLIYRLST